MCILPAFKLVYHVHAEPKEARRWCWIVLGLVLQKVLSCLVSAETQIWSSVRAAPALTR